MGCFCCIAQKLQNRRAFLKAHFIGQYRIILSADTASEVRQLPERCLSRKAGIMRCCLIAIEHARIDKGLTREDLAERIRKSERYVAAIERGERTPSLKTCYAV